MYTAFERRQDMLEYLCRKRTATRQELAEMFGVHKNTIDNDLYFLTCSYPIFTKPGRGGYVYIEDGYSLNTPKLKAEQQGLLEKILVELKGSDAEIMKTILERFGTNANK